MYTLETIKENNRKAAKAAKGKKPYVAKCDGDDGVLKCSDFGDYRPAG